MVLAGATPPGRHTEQHDVFFGIAENIRELIPQVIAFWPEGKKGLHLDAWREVTRVDGYSVEVVDASATDRKQQLFFINLGGYKKGEFDEFHYKLLVAAPGKGEAISMAKQTVFFRHTGFKGARAHVDDKYGVDVDDLHVITDILPVETRQQHGLLLKPALENSQEDVIHLGYFKLDSVDKWAPKL